MPLTRFEIGPQDFEHVPWDEVVPEKTPLDPHAVEEAFRQAAKQAEQDGKAGDAGVYWFLSTLMSFWFNLDRREQPFMAEWESKLGRTAQGEDLEDRDFEVLRKVAESASNLALLARANDLLWTFKKDHRAAERSIRAYLRIGDLSFDPEHWVDSEQAYRRALQLGLSLGKNPIAEEVLNTVKKAIQTLGGSDPRFFTVCLLEDLLNISKEKVEELVPVIEAGIACDSPAPDWDKRVRLLEILRRVYHRSGKAKEARSCLIRVAETYLDQFHAEAGAIAMLGRDRLEKAIEAYRRAGKCETQINDVLRLLQEVQRRIPKELRETSIEIDLTDVSGAARKAVGGKALLDAIRSLSLLLRAPRKAVLRQEAEDGCKQFLHRQMFSQILVSDDGRKIAAFPAPAPMTSEQADVALEAQMMMDLRHTWGIVAQGCILPATALLRQEHHITMSDLKQLTSFNPLIPEGAESVYVLGLYYGFHGQFAEALGLLIPALENSLRHILELDGLPTWEYDKEGVQDVKSLNKLFTPKAEGGHREDLEERLGDDMVFELRALLSERAGANLRNEHAHGKISFSGYFSGPAITLWGRVLHLVVVGALHRDRSHGDTNVREEESRGEEEE